MEIDLARDINIAELIKERANIAEAVGRLVQLRRSGKSWSGLCPFHKETDGSFHIYEESGIFKCFGCGAKGDIITFYEKYYNLSFLDACERLAKEYGIDWQPGGSFQADGKREALYEANRFAGSLYYEAIKKEGNPALSYMAGRGIDTKTISKFRIGYADASGYMLAGRVEGDEGMRKAAEEVGLIYKYSGRYRDRFDSRVIFPIVSTRGKVIGFGGRDIGGKSKAKYINSAASSIYVKGSNLYGLNITHSQIREKGFAILVEGYIDVVALYMQGVTNVCAQLGTAFTAQQAKLLGRYTKNVVLALDSDESGQQAALSAMDILSAAGLKVRVLVLEGAKDPDDYIRAFGREAFDRAVRAAAPMYDFRLERMKRDYETDTSDGLADYLKAAAEVITPLSPVEQDLYVKKLSRDTGISENAIAMQIQGIRQGAASQRGDDARTTEGPPAGNELFCAIIGLAIGSEAALEKVAAYRHLFAGTEYSNLLNIMLTMREQNGSAPTAAELAEILEEEDQGVLELACRTVGSFGTKEEHQIAEYLIKLELAALEERAGVLKELADQGGEGSGEPVLKELMELHNQVNLLKSEIRNRKRGD